MKLAGSNPWIKGDNKDFLEAVRHYVGPQEAAQEILQRRRAQDDLFDFTLYTKQNFEAAVHHKLVCQILQWAVTGYELPGWGKIDRIAITAPPRHTKSELTSIRLPAWCVGKNPHWHIIATSYSDSLATGFGRQVRNLVGSPRYQNVFPGTQLAQDSKAADRWNTTDGGSYISSGFGGSITGFGMHLGIIDDYVKGRADAKRAGWWNFVTEWYKNDFYTRLMPGGVIIIIATRWDKNDLIGWLTPKKMIRFMEDLDTSQEDRWLVINLPALATENDLLGRKPGEALWPSWYPESKLKRIKGVLRESFNAIYQGEPTSEGGNIYKSDWWEWYDELPTNVIRNVDSWDTGFKENETSAYSANVTFAECTDGYYITDWFRKKMIYPTLKATLINRWEMKRTNPVLIEDKASGTSLCQELQRGNIIPVIPIPCNTVSKAERANAASPMVESGRVKLPRFQRWANEFVEMMADYPSSLEKDTMDAFSQGIIWLNANAYAPPDYETVVARRFGLSSRGFL